MKGQDMNVDISGLSKASVLAALYNRSKAQGMGWLHFDPTPMTEADAAKEIAKLTDDCEFPRRHGQFYFDYLNGRVMKVDLSGDTFNPAMYDRDNGAGAAQRVIDQLRSSQAVAA